MVVIVVIGWGFIKMTPSPEQIKKYVMIVLPVALLVSLGFNIAPEPNYYCEVKQLTAHCFSLSSTSKTCYTIPNKLGGKICDSLWLEIPKVEELVKIDLSQCPQVLVIAYTNEGKFFCNKIGKDAKCIEDGTLEMPWGG